MKLKQKVWLGVASILMVTATSISYAMQPLNTSQTTIFLPDHISSWLE
ncbi:MAG: hypothetical protein KJ914_08730 [Gammaproteobacteria bacterium]|nr:hypothetical protein [Gammaproteobacteria bacterium]MBU1723080.1 hypothetical protein [Gammaproteobacteria bacterium]MBU2004150.1 hypothetical protein [Gammaproteobacteria bacterium]